VIKPELDDLERALAQVDRPEPPAELTDAVMRRVADVEARFSGWRRWRRGRRSRQITNFLSRHRVSSDGRHAAFQGGVIVRTKILWGVTGLAAMAIVTFFVFGYPPVDRTGTEATINQAQRYQGATLSAKDVSVPDTDVQQFIQSDTFDRLLKDREAREALLAMFRNEELAQVMANAAARELAMRPGAVETLGQANVQALFANAEARGALAEANVAEILARPNMREHLQNVALLDALAKPGVKEGLAAPAARMALARGNMTALREESALVAFASRPGVAAALEDADLREALAQPGVANALANAAVQAALANEAALVLFASPNLAAVMVDAKVSMALAKPSVAAALAQPAVKAGLANVALMNAMAMPAMGRALAVPANHAAIAAGLKIER
jgi:hypothetical protein